MFGLDFSHEQIVQAKMHRITDSGQVCISGFSSASWCCFEQLETPSFMHHNALWLWYFLCLDFLNLPLKALEVFEQPLIKIITQMQKCSSLLLLPHGTGGAKPADTVSQRDWSVVEVIVRCEVIGHVRQDHSIFKYREDGVHPRLTVGVVSPVAVHRYQDRGEVGH